MSRHPLTARQQAIVRCRIDGLNGDEIAALLGISKRAVHRATTDMYVKLRVKGERASMYRLCYLLGKADGPPDDDEVLVWNVPAIRSVEV